MGASHKSAFCRITFVAAASGAGGGRRRTVWLRSVEQQPPRRSSRAAFPQLELRGAKSQPAVTLFFKCADFICTQNANVLRVSKSVPYFFSFFCFFVKAAEETGL